MFLVAIAMSRSLVSSVGARTTPDRASDGFLNVANALDTVSMGCLTASSMENLDVSLTRVGLPESEECYRYFYSLPDLRSF